MDKIVKNIRDVISKKQDVLYEQLNFGACDASVEAFKTKFSLQFPDLFFEFYQAFNGSVQNARPVWGKMTILSLSEIVSEKKVLDSKQKKTHWNHNWVPFLKENEDTFVCINLTTDLEAYGKIIQFNSQYRHQPVLFNSFKLWLEAFYFLISTFEHDIVIENNLYRSYFNSKIEKLIN
ncbi:MAG: SMI1/KNR4 family protein [Chloroflexia bacterium]|nr:SMI1/KNR4 family protein [Chloroflexia bacterium]